MFCQNSAKIQEKYKKVLEEKYGKITVNLEDGSYEEMKEESDEQAD